MVIEDSNKMVKDLRAVIKSKKAKQPLSDGGHKEEHQHVENEARESRGHWKHPLDFLFSCISVSVGLGSMYNNSKTGVNILLRISG